MLEPQAQKLCPAMVMGGGLPQGGSRSRLALRRGEYLGRTAEQVVISG